MVLILGPSLPCDSVSQETSGHSVVARTRSLNIPMSDGAQSQKNLPEVVVEFLLHFHIYYHQSEVISFNFAVHLSLFPLREQNLPSLIFLFSRRL